MGATAGELVAEVLGLESARLLAMAAMLRLDEPDVDNLRDIDAALEAALEGLASVGVNYPGHLLGARYELGPLEYVVLQLALMPYHRPDDFGSLSRLLAAPAEVPRRRHALLLLSPPTRHEQVWSRLLAGTLLRERLVIVDEVDGEVDPALLPHQAVLELYGLGPQ